MKGNKNDINHLKDQVISVSVQDSEYCRTRFVTVLFNMPVWRHAPCKLMYFQGGHVGPMAVYKSSGARGEGYSLCLSSNC